MKLHFFVCAFVFSQLMPAPAFAAGSDLLADDPRRGEEVGRICFARNIDNFRFVDGHRNVVLLEEGINDWYLVELLGACANSSLRFSQSIAIDTRPGGGCLNQGDRLIFSDSFRFNPRDLSSFRRCLVGDIYEWDEDALDEASEDEETPDEEENSDQSI